MLYKVRWEIDIDADTPIEAAQKALAIHRDPYSIATVFEVEPHTERWEFDLRPFPNLKRRRKLP